MFNENDIKPESLMQKQKELYLQDIEDLVSQKVFFIETSCPACGAWNAIRKFRKYELEYHECRDCKTVYISPRPTPDILDDYYEHSKHYEYWSKNIFPLTESVRRKQIFIPRVEELIRAMNNCGCKRHLFVEIGAGSGIFCEELNKRELFERIIAIEPTPSLAQSCRKKGLATVEAAINDVEEYSADVIAAFEVIEHIYNPRDFLQHCFNHLNNNGIIMLTCPNVSGFDISVLEDLSDTFDAEHLNYFNLNSLSLLMESIGFRIIERTTPGKLDVDIVRNKILSEEYLTDEENFINKMVLNKKIGDNFQKFLIENNLSSNMMIIARKP